MAIRILALTFFIVIMPGAVFAEDCHIEKQATLPITFNRFVPTVPVTINRHEMNIGVDTGAEKVALTPETAEQLSLPKDYKHSTKAIGTGEASVVNNVIIEDFEFANSVYAGLSVAAVSMKAKPSASVIRDFGPEAPMAGLIGTDILSNYDVEYSPLEKTMTLYKVSGCEKFSPPWQGQFVRVPATLTASHRLVMPIILNGHKLTALFDSGSSGFELAKESAAKAGVTEEMLASDSTEEGSGIGDHGYKASVHQFDSLVIGREGFHGAKISIVDFPARDADALVGEDYMHARKFWLSYSTSQIFIQRATTPK